MKLLRNNRLCVSGLLCGSAILSVPAVAQVAPTVPTEAASATAAPAAPAQDGIADIIVTAQRKAENSQRAPIAIDVIQSAALANVTQPENLSKLAPAVQMATAGGASPLLYVRGVGTFSSNPYTDSAVAVNYDGIYLGRPTSAFGLYYDLDRIEVLKGPQGTLYGRNATGGALNVIPMQPKLNEREASGTISVGNYQSVNAQAAVNLPISDIAALRVAGTSYTHGAYNDDGTYNENGAGGRVQLLVKPSGALSVRLGADYFHLGGSGATGVILSRTDLNTGAAVPLNFKPNSGLYDPASEAVLNSTFVSLAGGNYGVLPARPYINNRYYGVNAEVSADFGFATLTTVAAWRRADIDNLSAPTTFLIQSDETDEQYSLETRLAGKVGPIDWLVGGYMFKETVDASYQVNNNLLGAVQDFSAKNDSYAGFGRLTWHLTDHVRLTGAGRYTQDEKTFDGSSSTVTAICTSVDHLCPNLRLLPANIRDLSAALASIGYVRPAGSPVYVDATGASNVIYSPGQTVVKDKLSPSKLTYRFAAEFEPRPGSLLYASVETGYRSGGFSFSSVRPVYDPESITAYTIGMKNRFLGNRLQINIEGFVWKYNNQQISHQTIGTTGGVEFVTENIGSSTNKGVEVEVTAKPWYNTLLNLDVQYLDAKNDKFVYNDLDSSSLAGLPAGSIAPATNCPYSVVPGTGTYRIDCSGLRALRSPTWTLNMGVQHTIPLREGLELLLEGSTHYQSSNIVMFERRSDSVQGAYWLSDASVTLSGDRKAWSFGLFVSNIADKRVLVNTYYNSFNGITSGNYNAPRTFGARLSFKI